MKFEQIKEKIINGNKYYLFNMKPDKPYLLVKGKTKTELKRKLKEKVIKNPNKYKETECILMFFEFQEPDNRFTVGDLLVHLQYYDITEKLQFKGDKEPIGHVYFKKSYLERENWSETYLRNIIYLYKLDKIRFNPLGQPGYNELNVRIRHALYHYEKLKKNILNV